MIIFPKPWNLCICYFTWQSTVLDGIKVANQLTGLVQERSLDFPSGPNVITSIFKDGRGSQEGRNQREAVCGILSFVLLALKMEEYPKHRNIDRLQQPEKVKKWILPQNLQKNHCPVNTLIFTQESPIQTSGLQNSKRSLCCFKLLSLWYCYKSNRKLMQMSRWKKISVGSSSPQQNTTYLLKKTYKKLPWQLYSQN